MDGRSMVRQQPVAFVALIASAMCSAAPLTASRPVPAVYGIVASIDGKPADGLWDYASIDSESQRLYLAQSGVTVLDLRTSTVMAQFASDLKPIGPVAVHSVVSLGGNMLAVSDSSSNSVRFFSAETGKPRGRVVLGPARGPKDWRSPDELLFDPHSGYLVAVNGDRGSLSLIQPATFTVAGEIPVDGRLEFAAANSAGLIYVNETAKSRIAVVDLAQRRVAREIPLRNCEEPTGLAYDAGDQLILSVCSNGLLKFVSEKTAREVASVRVGAGADCVLYDDRRHLAFVPSGDEGTLTVIVVRGSSEIRAVQTVRTRVGSRLGALDSSSGRIYLPAAQFGPPAPPLKLPGLPELPGINPGSFEFLVIGPIEN